jgi:negative regulator of flagellin synthesis FlgM
MHIHGPSSIHGPHGVNAPHITNRTTGPQPKTASGPVDRVDISPAAQAASRAAESSKIRHDLVNLIRSQIANGTYDTPEKMDIALERLLDEIG